MSDLGFILFKRGSDKSTDAQNRLRFVQAEVCISRVGEVKAERPAENAGRAFALIFRGASAQKPIRLWGERENAAGVRNSGGGWTG